MKKNKKTDRKTAANQQIRDFFAIFNYRYKWIEAKNPYIDYEKGGFKRGKNGKLKPDWRRATSKRPIRQKVLEHIYNDPTELIGLSFDTETRFICFDIDITSRYHFATNEPALREILGKLEQIGLVCPLFVRSSYSNGLHVFYIFKRGINSFNLACAAQEFLREQDITIQSGTLEIFPNPKAHKKNIDESFFNGIKLPLQPNTGSVILNDNFEPIGNDLETFEKMMAFSAEKQDLETLEIACKKYGNKVRLQRCRRNSNSLKNFLKDLEKAIACGYTGKGQTNLLLLDIGCYGVVKERLDEEIGIEPLADYIKEIITSLDGYKEYCGHQHEIDKRCREVAKSCQEYYWAAGKPRKRNRKTYKDTFGRTLDNSINGNDAKTLRAIQKLEAAIANIQDKAIQGLLEAIPQNITAYKKLVIEDSKQQFGSGISPSTLNKTNHKTILQTAFHTFLAAVAAGQIAITQPVEAAPVTTTAATTAEAATVTTIINTPKINNPINPTEKTKPTSKPKTNTKPILKSIEEQPTPTEQAQQSKISLEKKLDSKPKTNPSPEKEIQQLIEPKVEPKKQSKPIIKIKPKTEPKTEDKTQPETKTKTPIKSTPKTAQSQSQRQKYTPCIKESKTETPKPAPRLESTHLALYVGFGYAHSPDLDFSFAFPEFSNLQNITKSYTQNSDANPPNSDKQDLSVTESLQAFEASSPPPESKSSAQASLDLLDLERLQQAHRELSLHEIEPIEQQQERLTLSEESSKPELTQTKRHITPEEQAYYQELLKRHPHLNALEQQRTNPEYQQQVKGFFARIRGILDGVKRQRRGRDEPPSNKT